jgi:Protein of unknown function (DUF3617)
MKRLYVLAALLMLAAACSRGSERIQPGRWEFEVVTTSIDAPGLSPEVQQTARAQLNRPQRNRECVTAANAANPLHDLREQLTRSPGATCQTSDDVFAGGVIRFRSTCRPTNGAGQIQLNLEGRFEPIALQADLSIDVDIPNPAGGAAVTLHSRGTVKGRRLGDCAQP